MSDQPFVWVPINRGDELPPLALRCGFKSSVEDVYVARKSGGGEVGTLSMKDNRMQSVWCHHSGELSCGDVLVPRENSTCKWCRWRKYEQLPEGAVSAGQTPTDGVHSVYVGRDSEQGKCGKINVKKEDASLTNNMWLHGHRYSKEEGEILVILGPEATQAREMKKRAEQVESKDARPPRSISIPSDSSLSGTSIELPEHWSGECLTDQRWIAVPVPDGEELDALKAVCRVTKPDELGKGRDAHKYPRAYRNLQVHCAWRIEHRDTWPVYDIHRHNVSENLRQAKEKHPTTPQPFKTGSVETMMSEAASRLPGQLNEGAGETWLLHGTQPGVVLSILQNGFTDRVASLNSAFGIGIYLAENIEKVDQYAKQDPHYEHPGHQELHGRLFRAGGNTFPDEDIFYCFVVRAAMGAQNVIQGLSQEPTLKHYDLKGEQVFLDAHCRQPVAIPGVTPPIPYNSLIVETGKSLKRFREFVLFSSNVCAYPAYLVAYTRQ
jgi:hypothetical protein